MPELPDVENFRRYLDATSLHRKITEVEVADAAVLRKISAGRLSSSIQDRKFESTERLGKYIFVNLDNGQVLMMHFGMSGFLKYFSKSGSRPPHARVLFGFSNGYTLAYDCQRKLGRIRLADDMESIIREKGLGLDAMDPGLGLKRFRRIMGRRRGMIKTALMNQSAISGIGNIYSDEILFQAGIHPERKLEKISDDELKRVYRMMKRVLGTATERKANPDNYPPSYLAPLREEGSECPGCGGRVEKIKVNNRGTYLCPRCQN
ncbi:MAG: hypothetical protein GF417_05135 [Candidatus Latescibacteria bacterium]|nr:hypothetical protein [bacterium]MBD3423803.1 hypothetical protein [Candidatus Latescibacterota bacterium]